MNEALFVYGTLMDPEVWRRVTGRRARGEPARLDGWQARLVRGRPWPGLVEMPGGVVHGLVYRGVTLVMWRRLDRYEGAPYRRRKVEVRLADGRRQTVWVYRWRPRFHAALVPCVWSGVRRGVARKQGRRGRVPRRLACVTRCPGSWSHGAQPAVPS